MAIILNDFHAAVNSYVPIIIFRGLDARGGKKLQTHMDAIIGPPPDLVSAGHNWSVRAVTGPTYATLQSMCAPTCIATHYSCPTYCMVYRVYIAIACLTVMSLDQSISEQEKMLDRKNLVQEAYKYLTEGIYPAAASSNEKQVIGKKSKNFSLHHGELFYIQENKQRPSRL